MLYCLKLKLLGRKITYMYLISYVSIFQLKFTLPFSKLRLIIRAKAIAIGLFDL